eukprot:GEMP01012943.1.p1 GENE.GEMP01012943.1~~GEMP01012943.1.p1  ORF type:complete len:565 (+),score=108.80 GEMP01012943.1:30-1697(+)
MVHPIDWEEYDVGKWLLREFPADKGITEAFAGYDGKKLWYSTEAELSNLNLANAPRVWESLILLRAHQQSNDVLIALRLQRRGTQNDDVDPSVRAAFNLVHRDVGRMLKDRYYSEMVDQTWQAAVLDEDKQVAADAAMAEQLAAEFSREDAVETSGTESASSSDARSGENNKRPRENAEPLPAPQRVCVETTDPVAPAARSAVNTDTTHDPASSSSDPPSLTAAQQARFTTTNGECQVCFSNDLLITLECRDQMCLGCLRTLCNTAINDRSLIPISCCGKKISPELIHRLFTPAQCIKYAEMLKEKDASSMMHCPNKDCGSFIDLVHMHHVTKSIECPSCKMSLCVVCKTPRHSGQTCQEFAARRAETDPGHRALQSMAKNEQWKQCPKCAHMIELRYGCNHITCLCGFSFCYQCSAKWKRCDCNLWTNEQMLLEAEFREREFRELVGRNMNPQERELIQRRLHWQNMQGLECDHSGGYRKEYYTNPKTVNKSQRKCYGCEKNMVRFAYQCNSCRRRLCYVCWNNRPRPQIDANVAGNNGNNNAMVAGNGGGAAN